MCGSLFLISGSRLTQGRHSIARKFMGPKPKTPARSKSDSCASSDPDWPPPPAHNPWAHVTQPWLDEVAAGTDKSIRDTQAWKEAVMKHGLAETRRLLPLSLPAGQCPAADPLN